MANQKTNIYPFPSAGNAPSQQFNIDQLKKNNTLGSRLAEARTLKKLSQPELANKLRLYNIHITVSSISKWEKGASVPNAYQLLALCNLLGIADPVNYFTGVTPESTEFSPELNTKGLNLLQTIKDALIASGNYAPASRRTTAVAEMVKMKEMKICTNVASAGTGNFLGDDQFDLLEFPVSQIPEHADYGIRISGDSMTPYYTDGQIVWVEQCKELNPGEVGIFVYNGEGYLKQYQEVMPDEDEIENYTHDGRVYPKIYLVSFNRDKYQPIRILPENRLDIIGRVLN